ncbi:pteridine reductase [Marinobacterium jannaschii]|uniref:pteridine reductase n=1 Tax=Marinobacterium jannaschii TaxID=64970 RepID=UPI0004808E54|nr:pteridine reductase [Marinobacterium jannaschii]
MAEVAKVALVTGAAQRIGAVIARTLHYQGYRVLLHYRRSFACAEALAQELNAIRTDSCRLLQADLEQMDQVEQLAVEATNSFGRIDLLVNNASDFYPTPLESSDQQQWDSLINSNLRGAYFLCARLADQLKQHNGAVINLIDIHAQRALPGYPIYSIAKAGLQMMTLSLAKELAPEVRVNGVAPGPILWPEAAAAISPAEQQAILDKTLLGRAGTPEDIASAVAFLARAPFITGQVLAVDGGKSLYSH